MAVATLVLSGCAGGLAHDRDGLIRQMGDNDMQSQSQAGRRLDELFGEEGLIAALHSDSATARGRAAIQLQFHRTSTSIEALIAAVNEPAEATRRSIMYSLAEICDATCIPTFERFKRTESITVSEEAIRGLETLRSAK